MRLSAAADAARRGCGPIPVAADGPSWPWAELPLWIPDVPDTAGFWAVSGAAAKAAGLRSRPFGESVRDTWQWLQAGGEVQLTPGIPPPGLDNAKERRVLTARDSRLAA